MNLNFDVINPVFNLSSKNIKTINEIETFLKDAKKQKLKKFVRKKSQVRSVYSSLAIENNSLSLEDVNKISNNISVSGKRKEIQEVKNAIELYENIVSYNWRKEKDLNKAHKVLMKYFDDDNGNYRKHGEGVKRGKKIVFIAPESTIVPDLMKSLFKYIKNNEKKIHPLVLSSIFHYYFVYIHPYTDGNGRVARFWVSLMLTDYNEAFTYLPFEETIYKHRKEYYKSIESCHLNGNANVFITFMLKIIKETIINTTQETTQKKINNSQKKIIELIKENPSVTRKEMAEKIGISDDGIKYNLNKLKQMNILTRVGSDRSGTWKISK
ncbi:MAG: Fic family protein [Erysipelotrichaceae bacterium]|nr:Fic family protein [Erysipelotrichaceae bacterium]